MILRNIRGIINTSQSKIFKQINRISYIKLSTSVAEQEQNSDDKPIRKTDKINRQDLVNQLINLYQYNLRSKQDEFQNHISNQAHSNWDYLKACFEKGNFVELNHQLHKLAQLDPSERRSILIKFCLELEDPNILEEQRFHAITIVIDHLVSTITDSTELYFLNKLNEEIQDLSNLFNLTFQWTELDSDFNQKIRLIKAFMINFQLNGNLQGLTIVHQHLVKLSIPIQNMNGVETQWEILTPIWLDLMVSFVGIDNNQCLQIFHQLWYSLNPKKPQSQCPLDYLTKFCLQSASNGITIPPQERLPRFELLFSLYLKVESYLKFQPYKKQRYEVDIQRIFIGMAHYYGYTNDIVSLLNFLDSEGIVPKNHYVMSTVIYHLLRLDYSDSGAELFNKFVKQHAPSNPNIIYNIPFTTLLIGLSNNEQWNALSQYFELRHKLPIKINSKLYMDLICCFKRNLPPVRLIQSIYYDMINTDRIKPSVKCLDIIARILPNYQIDLTQQSFPFISIGHRFDSFYAQFSSQSDLDLRFFTTMIHQLITHTPLDELESITEILSKLYNDLIRRNMEPTTPFLTTMLIVYLKLGRQEGVQEILCYLQQHSHLIDQKMYHLLTTLNNPKH